MFGVQPSMMPTTYQHDNTPSHSNKSDSYRARKDPLKHYNSNTSINSANSYSSHNSTTINNARFNSNHANYIASNNGHSHNKSDSIGSTGSIPLAFIRPTSPTMQHAQSRPSIEHVTKQGTLTEELYNYQHYQQQLQQQQYQLKQQTHEQQQQNQSLQFELQYPMPEVGEYHQCLQWLQQKSRPVLMRELMQLNNVPVPITAANSKHPSQIGGTQDVQIAMWKQDQVQVMPVDRWGNPEEVLAEIQTLHNLRRCKQVIQLFGYLPSANLPSGQSPALLLQQPSNGSLRQFLDNNFDLIQWPERYKLGLDIAQGLRYLTLHGIPCTMNSGNILVDADGVAILTGFGSPGGMITSAPCQLTVQPSGPSLVVYMAPERIMGKGSYRLEWSVYSLGILLWELSSGRMPFEEIITRAESGPRLAKNMEQLSSAIVKGLREESVPGTPDIYEQLYKMCWSGDAESRPPLDVVEETLQMLVAVEPIDMLMLPGEEMCMPISTVVSESIDGDNISAHSPTRSSSVRSISPDRVNTGSISGSTIRGHAKPSTLHEAISVSNADMTEWYILAGHDLNGYAIVPTFSLECEITPIQTCLGHFMPQSLAIFKELMEQDVDVKLLAKRSLQNCLHILLDRYIPFKNDRGSSHLFTALDMLLKAGVEVNALDVQGHTPLHLLMRNPRMSSEDVAECLKRMVAKGADTSIPSPKDGNVLALAAKYLHLEAARFILSNDILASEPESIDRAIEACMTMTGRATDTFVNLRSKTRELLKMWTGTAGLPRREKLVVKVLQNAGQLDQSGMRVKEGRVVSLAPSPQLACANRFYDKNVKKKRERLLSSLGVVPLGVFS
ncbi:hypothetical protein BX616_002253 [Lobosporangium transversale]|uniref:Protein kinase domain-containing protein n=1 Tax=Lobosporangium transversale TaxID=64571 RepID=A0A1Y2GXM0_9FUNG|nr:hypothetical protein BCR41DRAFT_347308 [Lobosporangium transversale]KAF9901479.1 hypothetical protein BX616_002253 [Lobosporangium transversale]ORZ27048.1 hypothetical protein BCR41DRAFT_347308 [Lobosporangium transversale]|eukprot:XP_021884795.1 hypothetical protein BCR41DRAFT_347308 [Lobosporangium transversale]